MKILTRVAIALSSSPWIIRLSFGVSQRIIPHGLRVSANGGKMHAYQAAAEGCFSKATYVNRTTNIYQETHSMSNVDLLSSAASSLRSRSGTPAARRSISTGPAAPRCHSAWWTRWAAI